MKNAKTFKTKNPKTIEENLIIELVQNLKETVNIFRSLNRNLINNNQMLDCILNAGFAFQSELSLDLSKYVV